MPYRADGTWYDDEEIGQAVYGTGGYGAAGANAGVQDLAQSGYIQNLMGMLGANRDPSSDFVQRLAQMYGGEAERLTPMASGLPPDQASAAQQYFDLPFSQGGLEEYLQRMIGATSREGYSGSQSKLDAFFAGASGLQPIEEQRRKHQALLSSLGLQANPAAQAPPTQAGPPVSGGTQQTPGTGVGGQGGSNYQPWQPPAYQPPGTDTGPWPSPWEPPPEFYQDPYAGGWDPYAGGGGGFQPLPQYEPPPESYYVPTTYQPPAQQAPSSYDQWTQWNADAGATIYPTVETQQQAIAQNTAAGYPAPSGYVAPTYQQPAPIYTAPTYVQPDYYQNPITTSTPTYDQLAMEAFASAFKPGAFFSDERMKDSELLGTTRFGVPEVLFRNKDDPSKLFRGVLAQDVERLYPNFVERTVGGLLKVHPIFAPVEVE